MYDAAIEGARGVCEFDFAAIATYDAARRQPHPAPGGGRGGRGARRHAASAIPSSLASMVVKNKLALPAGGEWGDRDDVAVFDPSVRFREFQSLLVLPLLVKDEVIGTFTVAARRPGAFPSDRREMLGVIANQVAISLQNGRMYQALEEQATTDGLTGLVNHRTFQERFSAMLARAERHDFAVALLLTDIDHFKKINDTYGHPTGDEVLRRVAALLQGQRAQDRHHRALRRRGVRAGAGGDRPRGGAAAGRAHPPGGRRSRCFESSKGPFKATLSLGIAVYPARRAGQGRADQERRHRAVRRQARRPQPGRPLRALAKLARAAKLDTAKSDTKSDTAKVTKAAS